MNTMRNSTRIVLIIVSVLSLVGCSVSPQPVESVSTAFSTEGESSLEQMNIFGDDDSSEVIVAGGQDISLGTTIVDESEMLTDLSEENIRLETESMGDHLISDSVEKKVLLETLWGIMLQGIDASAPCSENNSEWDRRYEVEAYLDDFTLESFEYLVGYIYPGAVMSSYVYYWPDYIEDVKTSYQRAAQELQTVFEGKVEYVSESAWIEERKETSALQIKGEVINKSYEMANLFIEGIKPYTAYQMWGSVLRVVGELYQERNGTILGTLAGEVTMTYFDFETWSGTYWVCLDDDKPVWIEVDFKNKDCSRYTTEITEATESDGAAVENCWLGIEFELVTTQTNK